jgi:hypothetical protein
MFPCHWRSWDTTTSLPDGVQVQRIDSETTPQGTAIQQGHRRSAVVRRCQHAKGRAPREYLRIVTRYHVSERHLFAHTVHRLIRVDGQVNHSHGVVAAVAIHTHAHTATDEQRKALPPRARHLPTRRVSLRITPTPSTAQTRGAVPRANVQIVVNVDILITRSLAPSLLSLSSRRRRGRQRTSVTAAGHRLAAPSLVGAAFSGL